MLSTRLWCQSSTMLAVPLAQSTPYTRTHTTYSQPSPVEQQHNARISCNSAERDVHGSSASCKHYCCTSAGVHDNSIVKPSCNSVTAHRLPQTSLQYKHGHSRCNEHMPMQRPACLYMFTLYTTHATKGAALFLPSPMLSFEYTDSP